MNKLALVLALNLLPFVAGAAPARAPAIEKGFRPLWNGKDLKGWVYGKGKDAKGVVSEKKNGKGYQIENGALFCTEADGGNLFSEEEFEDFTLRLEVRLSPNGNNGVGIRAPLEGDAAYVGMEIQVLDDSGSDYTTLRPAQYHGSIYDVVAAKRGHQKLVGEWNEEEIVAKGRHVTVKLNGAVIVDANLDDVKDEAVLKKHVGLANKKGHIGFLGHGTRVEFRNIRIKKM